LALAGILFLACNTGTTGGDEPPPGSELIACAFSADGVTYILSIKTTNQSTVAKSLVMDIKNASSSVMASSLVIGSVYEFTIIKPKPQNNAGAAEAFDSETIDVTVLNKTSLGNGKERYELKRSDNGTTFFITFDSNGIYSIQGLQGAKDGFLNPIKNNSSGLEGLWVGFSPSVDHHTDPPTHYIDLMSFYIEGNYVIMSSINNYGGPDEREVQNKMEIVIDTDTIQFTENQYERDFSTGEWVLDFDLSGSSSKMKAGTYTLSGDLFSFTTTEEYTDPSLDTSTIGFPFEFKRVPTN